MYGSIVFTYQWFKQTFFLDYVLSLPLEKFSVYSHCLNTSYMVSDSIVGYSMVSDRQTQFTQPKK